MVETFEEIEARRAAAGISWRRICIESKVSESTVHRLHKSGGGVASVDTVERLAAGLSVLIKADQEAGTWLNVQGRKRRARRKLAAAPMP